MNDYVLTAVYSTVFGVPSVALIRKDRPDWQAGLFNFIGGKVNDGEAPWDAAIRECLEEADLAVTGLEHRETFTAWPAKGKYTCTTEFVRTQFCYLSLRLSDLCGCHYSLWITTR